MVRIVSRLARVAKLKYFANMSTSMGTDHVTTCDQRGRLYLQDAIRAVYGTRFVLVESPDELVLIPVPADPLQDLAELGQSLADFSFNDLKRELRDATLEEASK